MQGKYDEHVYFDSCLVVKVVLQRLDYFALVYFAKQIFKRVYFLRQVRTCVYRMHAKNDRVYMRTAVFIRVIFDWPEAKNL